MAKMTAFGLDPNLLLLAWDKVFSEILCSWKSQKNMIDLTQGARKRAEELLIAQFNFFILGFIFVNISASGRVEIDTVNR